MPRGQKSSAVAEPPPQEAPETAPEPPIQGESPPTPEERATAAEARAEAAESRLARMEDRFQSIEERLKEVPTPQPVSEEPAPVRAPEGPRRCGYVNPQHPNGEYLIVVGKLQQIRDPNSPTGYRDHGRDGDVKIRFQNGVWISKGEEDDDKRIEWCKAHPELVHDVEDPLTSVWFDMKTGQVPTSRRDPYVSSRTNVDAALAGDLSALGPEGDVVSNVRGQVEAANRGE